MSSIKTQLQTIRTLIANFEIKYHRNPHSVQLLAVSKKQPAEKIALAYDAGQRLFGESYLQEALDKMAELHNKPDIEWHFIGPIQSNKTRKIAEHFAWVHSVCDQRIAQRLNDQRPLNLPPLNICIEINISHEATKTGISVDELNSLVDYCLALPHLRLRGLMAIPAPHDHFADQRNDFHQLAIAFQQLQQRGVSLDTLSLGMSEDFEAAISEGSTLVRIGSAIFGQRQP